MANGKTAQRLYEIYIPKQYMNGEGMTVTVNGKKHELRTGLNRVPGYVARVAGETLRAHGL